MTKWKIVLAHVNADWTLDTKEIFIYSLNEDSAKKFANGIACKDWGVWAVTAA